MADVTIPTIGAGVSNGAIVEQNFYNPTGAGTTSCEIINGHLDNANRDAAWLIDRSHIQRGVLSKGKTEGGTLSLDYFGDLFPAWNIAQDQGGGEAQLRMDELYQPIPGCSITFYIPYPVSFVALSWHINASAEQKDNVSVTEHASHPANYTPARIRLFYDGVRVNNRLLPRTSTMIQWSEVGTEPGLDTSSGREHQKSLRGGIRPAFELLSTLGTMLMQAESINIQPFLPKLIAVCGFDQWIMFFFTRS